MAGPKHKRIRCSKCRARKALSAFYLKSNGTRHAWCRPCSAKYARRRRRLNGDLLRAQQRNRLRDPAKKAKANARCRAWHRKNKKKSNAKCRAWHHRNRKRANATSRAYYLSHRKQAIAAALKWQAAHRELVAIYVRVKNHRRRCAKGHHDASDIKRIFKKQRGRCVYCRVKLVKFHEDHIKSIARGGSNWPKNIQLLCAPCNLAKGAKDPIEFMRDLGLIR